MSRLLLCGAPGAAFAIALVACTPVELTGPDHRYTLPPLLELVGGASGRDGDLTIDCGFRQMIEIERVGSHWFGEWGGEAHRRAIDDVGEGAWFFADTHSDLRIDVDGSGAIALAAWRAGAPIEPNGISRFWDGIAVLRGVTTPDGDDVLASGAWVCRPMDTHNDSSGEITGVWELRRR
jgi:hypothetical protein